MVPFMVCPLSILLLYVFFLVSTTLPQLSATFGILQTGLFCFYLRVNFFPLQTFAFHFKIHVLYYVIVFKYYPISGALFGMAQRFSLDYRGFLNCSIGLGRV